MWKNLKLPYEKNLMQKVKALWLRLHGEECLVNTLCSRLYCVFVVFLVYLLSRFEINWILYAMDI